MSVQSEDAADGANVLARIGRAVNEHDLDLLTGCFDEQLVSEQPAHPARAFKGRAQMEKNWAQLFAAIPDLHVTLVRSAIAGEVAWAEWDWHGTRCDGSPADTRGVTIHGVAGGQVRWVRLYMEPVARDEIGIDAAIAREVAGQ
jgi:ketosteroid isomerase-like protein